MRFVELFAGVGGFRLGIEQAIEHTECVLANEWDKYAAKTYDKNFKDGHIDTTDIRHIGAELIPDHDCLVGGFPCQAFSLAGKRQGFAETRGTLFFEIARILADKRPRHLVLENVKGLLTHDDGQTFKTILGVLTDLGYGVEWQVLNSRSFGVPQNRERVFIIGHLRDQCGSQILPIVGGHQENTKPSQNDTGTAQKFIKTRRLGQNGGLVSDSITLQATEIPHLVSIDHGELKKRRHANTIDANYYKGIDNHQQRTGVLEPFVIKPHIKWGGAQRTTHHTLATTVPTVRATQAKSGDNQAKILEHGEIRRLTPVECERLQGFPDNWTAGQSDTQRYKQMGNAVTVNVIKAIFERLNTVCKLN